MRFSVSLAPAAGWLLASLALLCAPAAAQQESAATLSVLVTSAATGEPLQGAQVLLAASVRGGITDEQGMLRLERVPPGVHTIEVRYLGFAPERTGLTLRGGHATVLAFALAVQPIPLAELRVRVVPRRRYLALTGFDRRRAGGFGTFFDREEIEARRAYRLSDILRSVPGVQLTATGFSDARASMARSTRGGRRCPIQYFVDGVRVFAFNIDDVRPHDVEGLEIYKGASQIPPDFNRGSAICGAIVIWTREPG